MSTFVFFSLSREKCSRSKFEWSANSMRLIHAIENCTFNFLLGISLCHNEHWPRARPAKVWTSIQYRMVICSLFRRKTPYRRNILKVKCIKTIEIHGRIIKLMRIYDVNEHYIGYVLFVVRGAGCLFFFHCVLLNLSLKSARGPNYWLHCTKPKSLPIRPLWSFVQICQCGSLALNHFAILVHMRILIMYLNHN